MFRGISAIDNGREEQKQGKSGNLRRSFSGLGMFGNQYDPVIQKQNNIMGQLQSVAGIQTELPFDLIKQRKDSMRKNEERKVRSKSSILIERPKKQQLKDNWLLDSMHEKGGERSLYHSMIIPSDREKHMEQVLHYDGYIDFEA